MTTTNVVAFNPSPVLDITAASRAFWLSSAKGATSEDYVDLTPRWPRVQLQWRVPGSINVEGKRLVQSGPLHWTATVWRLPPSALRDVPFDRMAEGAESLAADLDKALARGGYGMAGAQARLTSASLRRPMGPLDVLRATSMFDATAHVLAVRLHANHPVVQRQAATRGWVVILLDAAGRVVPRTKSVVVGASTREALSADEMHFIGSVLELSVHPIFVALDALNAGQAVFEQGKLTFRQSAAS